MMNKIQYFRCSHCGRRCTPDMIKSNMYGICQCKFCLKRGVVFYPELYK